LLCDLRYAIRTYNDILRVSRPRNKVTKFDAADNINEPNAATNKIIKYSSLSLSWYSRYRFDNIVIKRLVIIIMPKKRRLNPSKTNNGAIVWGTTGIKKKIERNAMINASKENP
jgi:hypothetical protein